MCWWGDYYVSASRVLSDTRTSSKNVLLTNLASLLNERWACIMTIIRTLICVKEGEMDIFSILDYPVNNKPLSIDEGYENVVAFKTIRERKNKKRRNIDYLMPSRMTRPLASSSL